VICISTRRKEDRDDLVERIDLALGAKESLDCELIRVNRANKQQD
jgi:hypothetical protein